MTALAVGIARRVLDLPGDPRIVRPPPEADFIAGFSAWFDADADRRVTWLAEHADRRSP